MAQIKEYVATDVLKPDNMASEAYQQLGLHTEREAGIVGRQYEDMAQDVQHVLGRVEQHQEAAETTGLYKQFADLTVAAHQDLTNTLATADPSKGNPLTQWSDGYLQPKIDALGENLSTPGAQKAFQEMGAHLKSSLIDRGIGEWTDQMKSMTVQNVKMQGQSLANAAAIDPGSVSAIAEQSDKGIDAAAAAAGNAGSPVSAQQTQVLKTQQRNLIYDNAARRVVSQVEGNPSASLDAINQVRDQLSTPEFQKNLSPTTMVELQDRLDRAHTTRMTAASSIIGEEMPSVLQQVERFGDNGSAEKLIGAYQGETPEKTTAWKQEQMEKLEAARLIYPQRQAMSNMSGPQMDTYLQNLQSAAASAAPEHARAAVDAYTAATEFRKQYDEEFHKDPAAFEINNNQTIGQLFNKFQQTQDPKDFDMYARFTLAQQSRLQPTSPGSIVSPQMKQEWAGRVQQITTGGAPVAQQMLADGAKQYGTYWPRVAQELMHAKVLSGPQFVAASMYSKPDAYGVASDVLTASATPWKQLADEASAKNVTQNQAITAAASAMAPFARTLRNVANGQELIGAYSDALARVLLFRGNADSGVASDLAGKMIADSYQMHDTTRIPTWQGLDTGKVQAGLDAGMQGVDFGNIVTPPSFSGLGPNDQKTNYVSSIKSTGHWFTNSDESGVTLYDAANHNVLTMKNGKAQPVTLTWQQLQDLGEKNLSWMDRAGRFFTQKPQ
jgi:hypothetical protein